MKTIKKQSDIKFIKSYIRYNLANKVIDSDNWLDLEKHLKATYENKHPTLIKRLFNEFKFSNYVLIIEYAVTDTLNNFLIEKQKIKDWKKLEKKFIEKIKHNIKITERKAKNIIAKETHREKERMLTPHIMLYCAGFGIGELIDYIGYSSNKFTQKQQLINKLTEFNEYRKLMIHNLVTSRENVDKKIEKGLLVGREIIALIDQITLNSKTH